MFGDRKESLGRPAPAPFKGKKVLLIEDDENDAIILERAFQKVGLPNALHIAHDVDEATAYLLSLGTCGNPSEIPLPEIVLLDLTLPRKSGFQFLEWVRAHPEFRDLPVLVFTSSRQKEDYRRAFELGANSYLIKPLGLEALGAFAKTVVNYWLRIETPVAVPAARS